MKQCQIKSAREQSEATQKSLATAQERLKSTQSNVTAMQNRLEAARLEYMSRFKASSLPEGADVQALALSQEKYEKLRAAISEYDRETYLQNDRAATLTELLKDMVRPNLELMKEEAARKRDTLQKAITQKGALESDIKNFENIKKQLDEMSLNEEKLRRDFALYDHIYRLCSGENALKTPIHQFVLGLMLDDIVACANGHLSELSRGRYSLTRSSTLARGGGTKGLDLSVDDSWSGGERSVSTLSGGEMFLASLSLAFGLSDVVQSYAGGIRLDSLFIDEGFGSLDTETLDAAMGALERLRTSGRLIGVISHVNELRERIPTHIEVSRLADGSASARIIAQ
jgi:exonuclease SbcC